MTASNVHAAHPKCPTCKKALYKSAEKGGKVTTEMPYKYCRNANCPSIGAALTVMKKGVYAENTVVESFDSRSVGPSQEKKPKKLIRKAVPAVDAKPKDSDVVRSARAKIAVLLQSSAAEAGLILALLNQGTGRLEEANAIIEEYSLTEKFGLQRF